MKKFTALSFVIIFFALFVTTSHAASPLPMVNVGGNGTGFAEGEIEDLPSLIITYLQYLAIILAIIYLMYGGIKLITAHGDRAAVESARKHIMSAVIGLVVVLGVFVMLQFIFKALGVKNPLNNALPTLKDARSSARPQ